MENYCNNCGNYGHQYKNCKYPILSYGIILYNCKDKNNIKIVLIEKKNTLSYIEFLRGKYSINNIDYIQLLFDRMNIDEKNIIIKNNFDYLWKNLWENYDKINDCIKKEYYFSKNKFNILKKNNIFDKIDIYNEKYDENEWEIPKGRRNNFELNKNCAIREFKEETNIDHDKYNIINNIVPLSECYKSINNVRYKHNYYIAKIKEDVELKIDTTNKHQVLEVKTIKWCNRSECLSKIRKYDTTKINLVNQFFNFIENLDDNLNI
tara:strand:+ start:172 stop:963 length:792 start_codon:yes stop_codon:yes gene_type:complete